MCGRTAPGATPLAPAAPGEMRDPGQGGAVVEPGMGRHGRIDVAINNAGGAPPAEAATASARFSQRIIELNLLAPLQIAQRANHRMQAGDGGSMINIASVSGHRASPTAAPKGAAKPGLLHRPKGLARGGAA